MSERAKTEFINSNRKEGNDAIATSLATLVAEAQRTSKTAKKEDLKPGSPEDRKGDLSKIIDYAGGTDPKDNQRFVIELTNIQPPIEATYEKKPNGEVYLGLAPTSGILPTGVEIVRFQKILNRTESGGFLLSFDGQLANGDPIPQLEMDYKDFILFFSAQYEDLMTTGMGEEQAKVVKETFAHLREAGQLPDKARVETVANGTPTIKKFDSKSTVVQSVQKQEEARSQERREHLKSQVVTTVEVDEPDAQGVVKKVTKAKPPEDIAKEVQLLLDAEEKTNGPTAEAMLMQRLTYEAVQTPEDLARAFQFLSAEKFDEKIRELDATYGKAQNEFDAAKARASASEGTMKKNFEDEANRWYEVRKKTMDQIEMYKKFKEQKDLVAERFFNKAQAGELSQDVIENVQKAMAAGNIDAIVQEMAKSSGVDFTKKAIDELDIDDKKKALLKMIIEIGGPFLIIALQMILQEVNTLKHQT